MDHKYKKVDGSNKRSHRNSRESRPDASSSKSAANDHSGTHQPQDGKTPETRTLTQKYQTRKPKLEIKVNYFAAEYTDPEQLKDMDGNDATTVSIVPLKWMDRTGKKIWWPKESRTAESTEPSSTEGNG